VLHVGEIRWVLEGSYIMVGAVDLLPESARGSWGAVFVVGWVFAGISKICGEAARGFLRQLVFEEGTLHGVLWRALRPRERKIRAMTRGGNREFEEVFLVF